MENNNEKTWIIEEIISKREAIMQNVNELFQIGFDRNEVEVIQKILRHKFCKLF